MLLKYSSSLLSIFFFENFLLIFDLLFPLLLTLDSMLFGFNKGMRSGFKFSPEEKCWSWQSEALGKEACPLGSEEVTRSEKDVVTEDGKVELIQHVVRVECELASFKLDTGFTWDILDAVSTEEHESSGWAIDEVTEVAVWELEDVSLSEGE